MATRRIEIQYSVRGFWNDKMRMCRPSVRSEEEAREVIAEYKEKVERNPKLYEPCERFEIKKRVIVHEFSDWETVGIEYL